MRALFQRLKELDPKSFEQFCFHLLKERHPGIDIKHVEGAGGDEGIDCFTGAFERGLVVWQCKSFPDGLKAPQREQIRESLRKAAKHTNLLYWVLCIPIDLDVKAHRWFERLKHSYEGRFQIGLLDASQITHELTHRRSLQEAWFPGAVLDASELRSLITRTGELSDSELASLTSENVHQYVQRFKERDARFTYEITFGFDRGPQSPIPRPGLVASMTNQDKRIDVFARDKEALQLNPPKINFTVQGKGVEKISELIKTGRAQDFGPSEIVGFDSDMGFLVPEGPMLPTSVRIGPSAAPRRIPMRVVFGSGPAGVVYEHMEFKVTRSGSEELELQTDDGAPFGIRVVMTREEAQISFESHFTNVEVRSIQKALKALRAMETDGHIEIYDLRLGKRAFRGRISQRPNLDTAFEQLIADTSCVADRFGVQLRLPEALTETDASNLELLVGLARGDYATTGECSVKIEKGTEAPDAFRDLLNGQEAQLCFERPGLDPAPVLFGIPVATGPIIVEAAEVKLKNAEQTRKAYDAVATGGDVELTFDYAENIRLKLAKLGAN